jgi:hypothetical protein
MKIKLYVRDHGVVQVLFKVVAKTKTPRNFNQITIHKFYVCGRVTGLYSPDRMKKNARHLTTGIRMYVTGKQLVIREERFY